MIRHIALEAIALHAEAEGREPLGTSPLNRRGRRPRVRFGELHRELAGRLCRADLVEGCGEGRRGRLSGRAMVNAVISSGMAIAAPCPGRHAR